MKRYTKSVNVRFEPIVEQHIDKILQMDTKCKQQNQQSMVICDYKCSLHWSALSKKASKACCHGLVPQCLACEEGVTEEEWLEANPEYQVE